VKKKEKRKLKKSLKKRLRKLVVKHGPEVVVTLVAGFVGGMATPRRKRSRKIEPLVDRDD